MSLEDMFDCELRVSMIRQHDPQINLASLRVAIKNNSTCYSCPQKSYDICRLDTLIGGYEMEDAARGIENGLTIHPKTLMAGFVEGSFDYKPKRED